jgi:hypothetical protein
VPVRKLRQGRWEVNEITRARLGSPGVYGVVTEGHAAGDMPGVPLDVAGSDEEVLAVAVSRAGHRYVVSLGAEL